MVDFGSAGGWHFLTEVTLIGGKGTRCSSFAMSTPD